MKYSAMILAAVALVVPASAQLYQTSEEAVCKAKEVLNQDYGPQNPAPFDLNNFSDQIAATQGRRCSGPGAGGSYETCESGCRQVYLYSYEGSDHEYCACLYGVKVGAKEYEKYIAEWKARRAKQEAEWAAQAAAREGNQ